ncbi:MULTISPECIES: glutathione S-transferase family protein [unclassified Serratia (in: enterobacteria)]|uniref:glutathione S-transferase family protein n=1 Tax=unclassified Serratia (in: enterobacteria) TaxID=2647522 RepID=UPI003076787F
MIILYGNPYSRANRVRWILELMEVPYEEIQVKLGSEGTGSVDFREINQNAKIPVLDDSGFILFESIPICLYLAKKYAPTTLYVNNVIDEAVLLQWAVWAMTELEHHIEIASLNLTWLDEKSRNTAIAEKEQAEILRCLSMLEKQIEKNGFLVNDYFTVADLIMCEILTGIVHAKVELKLFPHLHTYLKNNLSHVSASKAFSKDIISPFVD